MGLLSTAFEPKTSLPTSIAEASLLLLPSPLGCCLGPSTGVSKPMHSEQEASKDYGGSQGALLRSKKEVRPLYFPRRFPFF